MRGQGPAVRQRVVAVLAALAATVAAAAGCGAGTGSGRAVAGGTTWVTPAATAPSPSGPPATATTSPAATPPRPSRAPAAKPTGAPAGSRTFTLVNATNQTIWVASNRNADHPLAATGWKLLAGQSTTVAVPDRWGGRIWGRTGCTFDAAGHGHCQTGDCGGVFQCTGSGATPATLGEFTLSAWNGLDFYDVSMVDGSNLPMYINISHTTTRDPVSPTGCSAGGCTRPVNCPAAMRVSAGGTTVACETACAAFGNDTYCCRGSWAGRANCVPSKWPVDYAAVFKDAEPYAYSYAYDDSATMSCKGACDYRITFGLSP